MAQDATGTPTSPDNIPTFNTAVDAPTGNGVNAMMAAIQTALNARLSTPSGIASGEAAIWNGSAWVRSSVTPLNISGLQGYPADNTKFLRGDGTWAVPTVQSPFNVYKVSTPVTVNNSAAETDLVNVSIAANQMGASGTVRLSAFGDFLGNVGSATSPRFKLKLGAVPTVIIDTNVVTMGSSGSALRFGWWFEVDIQNLGATNSQWVNFKGALSATGGNNPVSTAQFTTGEGNFQTVGGAGDGYFYTGGNSAAIDTTAAMALHFSVTNGAASVSYETKMYGAHIEVF